MIFFLIYSTCISHRPHISQVNGIWKKISRSGHTVDNIHLVLDHSGFLCYTHVGWQKWMNVKSLQRPTCHCGLMSTPPTCVTYYSRGPSAMINVCIHYNMSTLIDRFGYIFYKTMLKITFVTSVLSISYFDIVSQLVSPNRIRDPSHCWPHEIRLIISQTENMVIDCVAFSKEKNLSNIVWFVWHLELTLKYDVSLLLLEITI